MYSLGDLLIDSLETLRVTSQLPLDSVDTLVRGAYVFDVPLEALHTLVERLYVVAQRDDCRTCREHSHSPRTAEERHNRAQSSAHQGQSPYRGAHATGCDDSTGRASGQCWAKTGEATRASRE